MPIQRLAELLPTMFLTAFTQQVDDLTAGVPDPVHTALVVDKSQYFNAIG